MSLRLRANRCGRGLAAVRVLPSVSPQIWARLVDARPSHDEQRVARTGTVSLLLSDSRPNNLPDLLTSFVGRRRELDELQRALGANRLITLTGAGGCGKTRLALRAASQMVDRFPGGIWWVELASVEGEELVGAAIAEALSVRPLPGVTPPQARTPVPAPATRKPASSVVHSDPDFDPGHEQQAGPRYCEPRAQQQPRRHAADQRSDAGAEEEGEHGDREVAEPGLEGRVAEVVLQVEVRWRNIAKSETETAKAASWTSVKQGIIDIVADPERLSQLDLAVLDD